MSDRYSRLVAALSLSLSLSAGGRYTALIDRSGRYSQLVAGISSLYPGGGMYTEFIPTLFLLCFYHRAILAPDCHYCNFLWFVCQPELKVYFKFLFPFNVTGK